MSPDAPDLDWIAERLPDVVAPDDAVTARARVMLIDHVTPASPTPELTRSHGRRRDRRVRRPWRRPVSLGLAAATAAAAAFAVVNVTSDGHSGSVSEAQAAQIVAHATQAWNVAPGQTLSYTLTDAQGNATQTAIDGGSPQIWSLRTTSADGQPGFDEGQEDGHREFYDRASNTIDRDSDTSKTVGLLPGADALISEMNAPGATSTVDHDATLDGQTATELTSTETDGTVYHLWVAASNGDQPLQFVWQPTSGPAQTTTWSGYQTVASSSSSSPAQLTRIYPSAKVTTLGGAAYAAAKAKAEASG